MSTEEYGEFFLANELWSLLLFGPDGPFVPQHSTEKLFLVLVQSPDLLALYTESKHIQLKIELKRGLRYFCFTKNFQKARQALEFGAYDNDLDIPACLMFLYQERCQEGIWDFLEQLAQNLQSRDANGLFSYFKSDDWKQLVAENRCSTDPPDKPRLEEIFCKSASFYHEFTLSLTFDDLN